MGRLQNEISALVRRRSIWRAEIYAINWHRLHRRRDQLQSLRKIDGPAAANGEDANADEVMDRPKQASQRSASPQPTLRTADMQSMHGLKLRFGSAAPTLRNKGWVVVIVERDEAVRAAAVAARDGYARLIKAGKQHEFDALLVEEISRFSRDVLGGMVEMRDFDKLGVLIADTRSEC